MELTTMKWKTPVTQQPQQEELEDIFANYGKEKTPIVPAVAAKKEPAPPVPDNGWENNARLTIIKMLTEVPELEQDFIFKTRPYGGKSYVHAMRVVLSRARANSKQDLMHFKLFIKNIEHLPTHDLVTILRSARSSLKQKGAYDDIIGRLMGDKTEGNS